MTASAMIGVPDSVYRGTLKKLDALRSDTMPQLIVITLMVPHPEDTKVLDELVCAAMGPLTRGCDVLHFVDNIRYDRERQYVISKLVPALQLLRPQVLGITIIQSLRMKLGPLNSMFYAHAADALNQARQGLVA